MAESEYIRKRQVQNIYNAFDYAEYKEIPFNYYCVFHLGDTIAQASDTAFKKIMTKYRRWLSYKRKTNQTDCIPAYVFTHENPNNNPHVNWCVHIPPNLRDEFIEKLPIWIAGVQGELEDHTLSSELIRQGGNRTIRYYITKGVDPEYIDYFNMRERYDANGPQGTIYGQRAGFSRCLGPKAIKDDEFDPRAYHREYRNRQNWRNFAA